jgi:hypothetical protein
MRDEAVRRVERGGQPGLQPKGRVEMAKYLILIYGDEQRWDQISADEMQQIDEGHRAFRAKAGEAIVASGQLESTSTASTLRASSEGRPMVTDGPFLETKEVVGGFYLLDVVDRETAISLASNLAEASHDYSGVEITPLVP